MACETATTINDVWVLVAAFGGFALIMGVMLGGFAYLAMHDIV